MIIILIIISLGLIGWIIYDVQKSKTFSVQDSLALLGIMVTVIGIFATSPNNGLNKSNAPSESPPSENIFVEIKGPISAPLGAETFYTFISENALKAEWSIGGFEANKIFVIDPIAPAHRIFVMPTEPSEIGNTFTIVVTVFGEDGQSARAEKEFTVIEGE